MNKNETKGTWKSSEGITIHVIQPTLLSSYQICRQEQVKRKREMKDSVQLEWIDLSRYWKELHNAVIKY